MPAQELDLVQSNDILADPVALRRRAEADGYLYFKGLLGAEKVDHARELVFAEIARAGLLDTRAGADTARVNKEAWDAIPRDELLGGVPKSLYLNVLKIEALHQLTHDEKLRHVWESVFQEEVLVHPSNMPRLVIPGRSIYPTPPHQD